MLTTAGSHGLDGLKVTGIPIDSMPTAGSFGLFIGGFGSRVLDLIVDWDRGDVEGRWLGSFGGDKEPAVEASIADGVSQVAAGYVTKARQGGLDDQICIPKSGKGEPLRCRFNNANIGFLVVDASLVRMSGFDFQVFYLIFLFGNRNALAMAAIWLGRDMSLLVYAILKEGIWLLWRPESSSERRFLDPGSSPMSLWRRSAKKHDDPPVPSGGWLGMIRNLGMAPCRRHFQFRHYKHCIWFCLGFYSVRFHMDIVFQPMPAPSPTPTMGFLGLISSSDPVRNILLVFELPKTWVPVLVVQTMPTPTPSPGSQKLIPSRSDFGSLHLIVCSSLSADIQESAISCLVPVWYKAGGRRRLRLAVKDAD